MQQKETVKKDATRDWTKWVELATDIFVILLIVLFLISYFKPEYMLSKTTTTGGDMGSHYVIAYHMTNSLLPNWRLIGWYPGWMAGTPMLQFYFVPPYLLMALLSGFISLEVAFKLVTVMGVFLLPLTTLISFRLLGFRFPIPAIAASLSLPFLFMESYSRFGGNIKSTLAGQFPHSISFAFTLLAIAMIYHGMRKNKHLALTGIIFSLVILNHIYTTAAVGVTWTIFFISAVLRKKTGEIKYLINSGIITFLLAGFWIIPMFLKFGYTMAPKGFYGFPDINQMLIPDFFIFYALAILGVLIPVFSWLLNLLSKSVSELPGEEEAGAKPADKKTHKKSETKSTEEVASKSKQGRYRSEFGGVAVLCAYFLAAFILFLTCGNTSLLHVRFLPILYYMPLVMAALGIGYLTGWLKGQPAIPIIVVLLVGLWLNEGFSEKSTFTEIVSVIDTNLAEELKTSEYVSHGVKDIGGWIKWNYEGLERKSQWQTYREINEYLKGLGPGRVNFEYGDYNYLGTPRVFEASPIFSEKDVMESLLLESSLTFPFFYYMQKEVSKESWWPGFPIDTPDFNLTRGVQTMRFFNIKYFVVNSEKVKGAIEGNENYHLLKTIDQFQVYSVNEDSTHNEHVSMEPVLVVTDDPKMFSFEWFASDYRHVPLVYSSDVGEYELENFNLFLLDKEIELPEKPGARIFNSDQLMDAVKSSKPLGKTCSVSEDVKEGEIRIQTDCVGTPLLVKTSYFPNWKVEGAKKIYYAAPSLMLVIPEKNNVTIYYGTVTADYLGNFCTILGILIVSYFLLMNSERFRSRVHDKYMNRFEGSQTGRKVIGTVDSTRAGTSKVVSKAKNNKYKVIALILIPVIAVFAVNEFIAYQDCTNKCLSTGYSCGKRNYFANLDSYDLGYLHGPENKEHNLECTASCGEGKDDLFYVPAGYVQFDMKAAEGTSNILVLRLWDNAKCRSGNLYINGEFFSNIRGEGLLGWNDYEFEIPAKYTAGGKITVKLEYDNSKCYGWDISDAWVNLPSCSCYN